MDEVSGNEHSIHWRLSQVRSPLKGVRHRGSKSRLPIHSRSLTVRRGGRRGSMGSHGHEWSTQSPGTQNERSVSRLIQPPPAHKASEPKAPSVPRSAPQLWRRRRGSRCLGSPLAQKKGPGFSRWNGVWKETRRSPSVPLLFKRQVRARPRGTASLFSESSQAS